MYKVKINWLTSFRPSTVFPNYDGGLSLTWLSSPKNGVFNQATAWCQCRDILIGHIHNQINGKQFWKGTDISLDDIYMAALRKYQNKETYDAHFQTDKDWLFSAKRLLNKLEKQMGWPLTKIQELSESNEENCRLFLISGSKKWMQAPQLLSLYLLIIKISKYEQIQNLKNIKQIHKIDFYDGSMSLSYFRNVQPFLWKIINNVEELFFFLPQKDMFINQRHGHGINNLIVGHASEEILDRFKKIKESV